MWGIWYPSAAHWTSAIWSKMPSGSCMRSATEPCIWITSITLVTKLCTAELRLCAVTKVPGLHWSPFARCTSWQVLNNVLFLFVFTGFNAGTKCPRFVCSYGHGFFLSDLQFPETIMRRNFMAQWAESITNNDSLLSLQAKVQSDCVGTSNYAKWTLSHMCYCLYLGHCWKNMSDRKWSWRSWSTGSACFLLRMWQISRKNESEFATIEQMTNAISLSKGMSNVTWRCMSIWMNAFCTDDGIEWLKCLSCKEDCWSKATNMIREMNKNVEFQFVEPLYCPVSWTEQEVLDFMFKEFLFNEE